METTPSGIKYNYTIGSQGGYFIVYPNEKQTNEEVKKAVDYIKENRDVVSIRVAILSDKINLFTDILFKHPKTIALKWYQINQDEKLIKKAVLKGWDIDYYIDTYVLPLIEQTEKENLNNFGNRIYN